MKILMLVLKKKRVCLKCGEKFLSKSPYNRVCDKCASMNERLSSNEKVLSPYDSTNGNEYNTGFHNYNS